MKTTKTLLKKNRLVLMFVVLLSVFISGCSFFSQNPEATQREVDNGYTITHYHINVNVNENNSYNITETLKVDFGSYAKYGESRGIYRYIPYQQTITILDENNNQTEERYHVGIDNIKAYETTTNTHYNLLKNENGNKVIRIQENQLVNGKSREYRYEYTYDIGYDRVEFKDFIYFNLLGYDINTTVSNFSFNITLPKDFSNYGNFSPTPYFYVGQYGESSTPSQHVNYQFVSNTQISGSVNKVLKPFESVTINLDLPNNYFSDVEKPNNSVHYFIIATIVLVSVAVIVLTMLLNKNKQIVSPVEFYPPNDMDSVLMTYTITGYIGVKKMTSLVIYFASKGYLNIIETDKKISLQKIKDLPEDAPSYQQTVFKALFESDKQKGTKDKDSNQKELNKNADSSTNTNPIIPLSRLEKTAGQHLQAAQVQARTSFGARIEGKSLGVSLIIMLLSMLPTLLFGLNYSYNVNSFVYMIPILFLLIVSVLLYLIAIKTSKQVFYSKGQFLAPVLIIVWAIMFIIIISSELSSNILDPFHTKFYVFIPILLAAYLAPKIVRLKHNYTESFGRVLGFRKTLILTEANRMKVLLKDDPSYFYNILPYAYVLGITDEFSKKFEGLAMQQPTWYYSNSTTVFDIIVFNRLITMSLTNFSTKSIAAMAPKSGGRIGGGGVGGGFSGGGFGGGGVGRA